MTTLVLSKSTEQTTIGELLRDAVDPVIEIRSEDGDLMATVMLPSADDGFDYTPYMAEVERNIEELERRARDSRPGLTTAEFLAELKALEEDK